MSNLWTDVQLSEVCEINMGQSPSSSTYNSEMRGIPFFQGKSEFTEKYAQVKIWCSEPQKIAQQGMRLHIRQRVWGSSRPAEPYLP